MNILLTGVNGFSGTFLAKYLLSHGHTITAVSRNPIVDPSLLSYLKTHPQQFNTIVSNLNLLQKLPTEIEAIIHTAATSPTAVTTTNDFIFDNILATEKLIQLAKVTHIKKFIFFSSLSIYGEIQETIVSEETPILNPTAYGTSKLFGELCLQDVPNMVSFALRLPAVVGKGATRHWLANTILRAKKNEKIEIFNPHAPFNNMVYIEDLAYLIHTLLTTPTLPGFTALTIGSEGFLKIQAIVETIIQSTKSSSEITINPVPKHSFTISSDKAKQNFGYRPRPTEKLLNLYLSEAL